ncbi:MAG: lipoyl synthase [Bacteroidales bacterium]
MHQENIYTKELHPPVRLPRWMKVPLPVGVNYSRVKNLIDSHSLHTICSSGNCPNKGECWSAGTATFMILGEKCTRHCRFCFVSTARPDPVDEEEPGRVADAIASLQLKHCVITSVTRDDLPDGGSEAWVRTIRAIRQRNPHTTMEVLIPDFLGRTELINPIILENPEVISHNIETVWRLTPRIRDLARYRRSLDNLAFIASSGITTKSGLMVGLGETSHEVEKTMNDLIIAGVRVLTIGQYLSPSAYHAPVVEYVKPEVFEEYRQVGLKMGFAIVESGPLVRSSYRAWKHVL